MSSNNDHEPYSRSETSERVQTEPYSRSETSERVQTESKLNHLAQQLEESAKQIRELATEIRQIHTDDGNLTLTDDSSIQPLSQFLARNHSSTLVVHRIDNPLHTHDAADQSQSSDLKSRDNTSQSQSSDLKSHVNASQSQSSGSKSSEQVLQGSPSGFEKPKTAIEQSELDLQQQSVDGTICMTGNPEEGQIIVKGANFSDDPVNQQDDTRTEPVIVARHIQTLRDTELGIQLSNYNLNYVFEETDERDYKFSSVYQNVDVNFLPRKVDLRGTEWGTIYDQGSLGSCVANSVAYCVRWVFGKKDKYGAFDASRLFIYYHGRTLAGYNVNQDTGMTIRDGYKSVAQYSTCSERNWPYIIRRFTQKPSQSAYNAAKEHQTFTYLSIDSNESLLKKCLKDGYPISFGTAIFQSFMSTSTARTGIVTVPNITRERRIGGHAMTIVGYDDDRRVFIVCNSWGKTWGDNGFCYIPYEYILNRRLTGDFWSARIFT